MKLSNNPKKVGETVARDQTARIQPDPPTARRRLSVDSQQGQSEADRSAAADASDKKR